MSILKGQGKFLPSLHWRQMSKVQDWWCFSTHHWACRTSCCRGWMVWASFPLFPTFQFGVAIVKCRAVPISGMKSCLQSNSVNLGPCPTSNKTQEKLSVADGWDSLKYSLVNICTVPELRYCTVAEHRCCVSLIKFRITWIYSLQHQNLNSIYLCTQQG